MESFTEGFLEIFDRVEHLRRLPDGRWLAAGRVGLIVEMGPDGRVLRQVSLGGKPILTRALSFSHGSHHAVEDLWPPPDRASSPGRR